MKMYKRPENCEKLVIPELNEEVKESIDNLQLKRDKRLSYMQLALMKSAIAVTELTDDPE